MTINGYIKGLIIAKFNSFIKLFGFRVFKKETVYRVKYKAFYLSSFLRLGRHLLFLADSIFKIPRSLSLLNDL